MDGIRPGERLRSEVVFAMLPGAVPWTLLRDVLEVDGRVRREAGRLEPLFRASPSAGLREANAIASESERLILGPTKRTLNVPTMALACLHPDNRDAFPFERKGRVRVGGQETVEIAFLEVARPTLNQDGAGADVPIRGRFWVRESDGAVLRSRTELVFASAGPPDPSIPGTLGAPEGSMTVTTEYGRPRPGPARAARNGRDAAVDERAGAGGDDLPARVPGGRPRLFRGAAPPGLRPRPRRRPGALLRLPPRRPGRRRGEAMRPGHLAGPAVLSSALVLAASESVLSAAGGTGVVSLGSLAARGRVNVQCDDGRAMTIEEILSGNLPVPPTTPG